MSNEALFDMPPIERPDRDPDLSADRRRTMRQRQDILAGYHPLLTALFGRGPWANLHPDAPEGVDVTRRGEPYTCGTCRFRQVLGHHDRSYPKCLWTDSNDGPAPHVSHSAATDVRAWWPACRKYTPGAPGLSLDAARWIPDGAP